MHPSRVCCKYAYPNSQSIIRITKATRPACTLFPYTDLLELWTDVITEQGIRISLTEVDVSCIFVFTDDESGLGVSFLREIGHKKSYFAVAGEEGSVGTRNSSTTDLGGSLPYDLGEVSETHWFTVNGSLENTRCIEVIVFYLSAPGKRIEC